MLSHRLKSQNDSPRSRSGILLCAGLGALALLFVAGFFFASKRLNHGKAGGVLFDVPTRPLRVAVYDWSTEGGIDDNPAARLRAGNPDVIFLRGFNGRDLGTLGTSWAAGRFAPFHAFYPSQNLGRPDSPLGVAILSRYQLLDSRAIPNPMSGAFGVWAVCVVDRQRFYVAAVQLSDGNENSDQAAELDHLLAAWRALKSPPLIAGGFVGSGPTSGPLHRVSLSTRGDGILVSDPWRVVDSSPATQPTHVVDLGPAK